MIQQGERRQTVVNLPLLPTDLPDGWPYGAVEQMILCGRGRCRCNRPSSQ